MRQRRDQRADGAGEVHVEHTIPLLPVDVLHRDRWRKDGGVGEHAVDLAPLGSERADRGAQSLSIRNVRHLDGDLTGVVSNHLSG